MAILEKVMVSDVENCNKIRSSLGSGCLEKDIPIEVPKNF